MKKLGEAVMLAVAHEIVECWEPVEGYVTPTPPKKLWYAAALVEASSAGVDVVGVMGRSHARKFARPRQNAYRRLSALGYGNSAIGRRVGRDPTTILYAVKPYFLLGRGLKEAMRVMVPWTPVHSRDTWGRFEPVQEHVQWV